MESLGKEKDLDGNVVHQGIAVYGNKGSTDQHAYVQQLRDGVLNFFITFIEVQKDRHGPPFEVEKGVTSGDYLHGFLRGTRSALYENGRESITISIPDVDAASVGALIALYERAVGFYGSLVNINAYHQPGVEAGKKAATKLLQLQNQVRGQLSESGKTAEELARAAGSGGNRAGEGSGDGWCCAGCGGEAGGCRGEADGVSFRRRLDLYGETYFSRSCDV